LSTVSNESTVNYCAGLHEEVRPSETLGAKFGTLSSTLDNVLPVIAQGNGLFYENDDKVAAASPVNRRGEEDAKHPCELENGD